MTSILLDFILLQNEQHGRPSNRGNNHFSDELEADCTERGISGNHIEQVAGRDTEALGTLRAIEGYYV